MDLNYINVLKQKIFEVSASNFNNLALDIFHFQYKWNKVYHQYVNLLSVDVNEIIDYTKIPFLPISFFKTHRISIAENQQIIFESSATTGSNTSKNYVADLTLYEISFSKCFELFFGKPKKYCIMGLLPSYLERNNSSLVYMVQHLMQASKHPYNGFYLDNYEALIGSIKQLELQQQPYILFGVTFALLQLAQHFSFPLKHGIIIETGGMKGRGKELIREELHGILKKAFHLKHVYSEYGMTELFSQAYLKENNLFESPPWMKILIRDSYNPFQYLATNQQGAVNVIDLANLYSCSFIETQDMGILNDDHQFQITGRIDNSEIRGCNLLMA